MTTGVDAVDKPNPSLGHPPSLTTTEAGRRLGVAQRTINYWLDRKTLPFWTTKGGHRRIPKSAVDDMLRQRREEMRQNTGPASISLLLVEDDPVMMEVYQSMVKKWRLPVNPVTAANGFDALIQVGRNMPDVIITDLMMPKMDGIEMVRVLREKPELKETEIVVVTVLDPEEINRRGGLPADVQALQKPVPADRLRRIFRSKAKALGIKGAS